MVLLNPVDHFISLFDNSEIVILSQISSQLLIVLTIINGVGNAFYLLLVVFIAILILTDIVKSFLQWLWFRDKIFNLPPLSTDVQNQSKQQKPPRNFGRKIFQSDLMKIMDGIAYVLLITLVPMGVMLLVDYYTKKQWPNFDELWFFFLLVATLYISRSCLKQLSFAAATAN